MSAHAGSSLHSLLAAHRLPDVVAGDAVVPTSVLHSGAEAWARAFERMDIASGDRVVCALPNGPAFVEVLHAATGTGVTLALASPGEPVEPLLAHLDARVAIVADTAAMTGPHLLTPARDGGAPAALPLARPAIHHTGSVALLMRTSGTSGIPQWIGLSAANIRAVLDSHRAFLDMDRSTSLCVLPWHHAFGLVLGLMPALLGGRRIVTVTRRARDVLPLLALAREHAVTHVGMVPLLAMRISEHAAGRAMLDGLRSGIVGGAPISEGVAAALHGTQLRVGYGQTEAGPGIMLGHAGEFRPWLLGRPVGCEVRIDTDGVLAFRGPNACHGVWYRDGLQVLDPGRWHRTDDLVTTDGEAYYFRGRAASNFKLSNGTRVEAVRMEDTMRQQLPELVQLVLTTTDGTTVDVHYSTHDGAPVGRQRFRACLGRLASWLGETRLVAADAWVLTEKGEIDRRNLPP